MSSTTRSSDPATATAPPVAVRDVGKRLGPTTVLAGLDFTVADRETVAVVGPSGVGKSTLLNLVAGLLVPDTGDVRVAGRLSHRAAAAVGYLTQRDTLLPWRTAARNVELPLQVAGVPGRERRARARSMLGRFGLAEEADRYPSQLSGGMRRRVALARLLVSEPRALLLDEPFSALDAQLRVALRADLVRLVEQTGRSMLLVTHDLEEALSVADRVLVLRGSPARIATEVVVPFGRPRDVRAVRFAAGFQRLHEQLWKELGDDRAPGL